MTLLHTVEMSPEQVKRQCCLIALPFHVSSTALSDNRVKSNIGLGRDRLVTVAFGEKTISHYQHQATLW